MVDDGWSINDELMKGVDESIQGLATGQSTLPVPAPLFYVVNGTGVPNEESPAITYGGWACDKEAMDRVLEETERFLPFGLSSTNVYTRAGTMISTYTVRSLVVAPIAVRSSWVDRESGFRSPNFMEGGRRHVQMLVVLGARKDKSSKIQAWGPAILSAKGYQAKNLLDSVDAWKRHLAPHLMTLEKGGAKLQSNLFWMPLGTFGKKYDPEMVGTGRSQSPITPIKPYLAEIKGEEDLRELFGGEPLAQMIVETYKISEVWRGAWRESVQEVIDPQTGKVALYKAGPGRAGDGVSEQEEDIPF